MGEIANDVRKGKMCDTCGCYFKNPDIERENSKDFNVINYSHGKPHTCWDCWNEMTAKEKKCHKKSKVETI